MMDQLTTNGGMILLTCAGAGILPSVLPYVPSDIVKFMNIGVCSISFGAQFWVGGIAGTTMFRNLKRRTFGSISIKLFRKYATLNTTCSFTALVTYLHLNGIRPTEGLSRVCDKWEGVMLVCCLLGNLANSQYLIPAAIRCTYAIQAREIALGLEDVVGRMSPLKTSEKLTDEDRKVLKNFDITHGLGQFISLLSTGIFGAYLYLTARSLKF